MRLFIFILLTAFSTLSFSKSDISTYVNLKQGDTDEQLEEIRNKQDLRLKTMKDAAIQLGIQVGFNDELANIKESIGQIEPSLNKIFDFGAIMRSTNAGKFEMFMLPGVVEEYEGSIVVDEATNSVITTEKTMEILETEKMVPEAPDWRNYLYLTKEVDIQQPFDAILPKSDSEEEQKLWRNWFLQGYEVGVNQANAEIIAKTKKLRRDFTGRVKYIRYTLDGKIEAPKLSFFREDLVIDDRQMMINQRTYRLNEPAKFNAKTGEWEILVLDNREGFRKK